MGGGFCSGAGPQRFGGRPMARVQHRRPLHPGLRPVVWRLLRFGILNIMRSAAIEGISFGAYLKRCVFC